MVEFRGRGVEGGVAGRGGLGVGVGGWGGGLNWLQKKCIHAGRVF